MSARRDRSAPKFHHQLRWNLASTDSVEDRATKARALGLLWVAGALLGILAPLLAPEGTDVGPAVLTASCGFPAALLLVRHARTIPPWVLHGVVVLGTGVVTLGVTYYSDPGMAVAVATFFVWPPIYASVFFPPRQALAHLVVIGVALAIALTINQAGNALAQWVVLMGIASVAGSVAGWVSLQLRRAANTDLLTGLPNRYALTELLDREVSRATRHGGPLCVALVDLDEFKAVNDTEGHLAGDRVLAAVAERWRAVLRVTDVLTRFAGDEFVVLLPHTTGTEALAVVERLNEGTTVTCSVGLAEWRTGDRADDLLARADTALYDAKHRGAGVMLLAQDPPLASA